MKHRIICRVNKGHFTIWTIEKSKTKTVLFSNFVSPRRQVSKNWILISLTMFHRKDYAFFTSNVINSTFKKRGLIKRGAGADKTNSQKVVFNSLKSFKGFSLKLPLRHNIYWLNSVWCGQSMCDRARCEVRSDARNAFLACLWEIRPQPQNMEPFIDIIWAGLL